MSQRIRQQENGEISLTMMSGRERQQENGSISNWDTENQFGGQDDTKGASMFKWHAIFLVSCVIALYVDPLFLYLPVINQDHKCVFLDKRLLIIAICFRSIFDLIYVAYIILGFHCAYKDEEVSHISGRTVFVTDAWKIIKGYLWSYNFLVDIVVILPIPQVSVPFIFAKPGSSRFFAIKYVLNIFVVLQYLARVLRIYLSWKKHIKSSSKLHKRVWIKAAFNIFLYILTSHEVGGLWYFISVQREISCWHEACEKDSGCTLISSFKCGRNSSENCKFLDGACPIHPPNTTLYDFGIFQNALESGIVSSTNVPLKILYCFWWGFRNLSSFGQNLQTSTNLKENCFAVSISIYGFLMFLYFIGNAQAFMHMETKKAEMEAEKVAEMEVEKVAEKKKMEARKEEEIRIKMIPIRLEIESWMARDHLLDNKKEQIINCIQHRLEQNKDFDIEKPILHLSKDLITEIKRHICLPLLKKVVPNLAIQGDQNLLERICESLKPKYYNEDIYILQMGEPLMMLFITQGSVCCFKTSNGENSMGMDSDAQFIEKGEIWGEELLEWGFNCSSAHKKWVPISTKIVKTTSKVEAFALTANDLKKLLSMHTRAAEATKVFVKGVFWPYRKENKNENSPKMSDHSRTSSLLKDDAPKSC